MADDIVERVAKAIVMADEGYFFDREVDFDTVIINQDDCRQARAAIRATLEAIRGPMYLSRDSQRAIDQLLKELSSGQGEP